MSANVDQCGNQVAATQLWPSRWWVGCLDPLLHTHTHTHTSNTVVPFPNNIGINALFNLFMFYICRVTRVVLLSAIPMASSYFRESPHGELIVQNPEDPVSTLECAYLRTGLLRRQMVCGSNFFQYLGVTCPIPKY